MEELVVKEHKENGAVVAVPKDMIKQKSKNKKVIPEAKENSNVSKNEVPPEGTINGDEKVVKKRKQSRKRGNKKKKKTESE